METDLLIKIGFEEEDLNDYKKYKNIIGDRLIKDVEDYFFNGTDFLECVKNAKSKFTEDINSYTLDLMFVLECLPFAKEVYKKKNYSENIFIDSMKDIKYKINECRKVYGVFGTFVVDWYIGFFKPFRFGLGRLQFNDAIYYGDDVTVNGFVLKNGDFNAFCHVPSSGKLYYDDCIESYKMAYQFFKDKLKDGILPVVIDSWLIYPPYQKMFGENSNIYKFAKDFTVFSTTKHDDFYDGWRVFGKDYNKNKTDLEANTSLQKRFIEYIRTVGDFGVAKGLLLFDGEKIIK